MPASYDNLGNTCHPKMSTTPDAQLASAPGKKPRYRECLKNHAVGIGAHAVDGCGDFLPAGADGTLDGLKCAACGCHRNFHRKESSELALGSAHQHHHHHHHHGQLLLTHHPHQQFSPTFYRTPSGYLHVGSQQRPLALPSTSGGGGSEQEDMSNPNNMGMVGSSLKKRHRTKFSQEQKDRMFGLAERLGWRIQKQDEAVVQHFCDENGIRRHVLKVWMHNNKHTLGKKP